MAVDDLAPHSGLMKASTMNGLHARLYADYERHYASASPSSRDKRRIFAAYAAQFQPLLATLGQGTLLDVGCGSGLLLEWLSTACPQASLHGIDASLSMSALSQKNLINKASAHHGDGIEFLRNHPHTYHGIFATDILEHMDDDTLQGFLDCALNALKPGGFLAVKVPNMSNLSSTELRYRDATHVRGFTEKSLIQCFRAFGFSNSVCYGTVPHSLGMKLRTCTEHLLHKVVYRVCGHTDVSVFTRTITAIGYKSSAHPLS